MDPSRLWTITPPSGPSIGSAACSRVPQPLAAAIPVAGAGDRHGPKAAKPGSWRGGGNRCADEQSRHLPPSRRNKCLTRSDASRTSRESSNPAPEPANATRIFAVSSCGACAWLQLKIIQFCACADRGGRDTRQTHDNTARDPGIRGQPQHHSEPAVRKHACNVLNSATPVIPRGPQKIAARQINLTCAPQRMSAAAAPVIKIGGYACRLPRQLDHAS